MRQWRDIAVIVLCAAASALCLVTMSLVLKLSDFSAIIQLYRNLTS